MKIVNLTNNTLLAGNAVGAFSYRDRLQGMIGRDFAGFDAMVFDHCNAVHTFFMKMPLDIVFIGGNRQVLKVCFNVRPWIFCIRCASARAVMELPAGAAEKNGIKAGDFTNLEISALKSLKSLEKS